MIAIHIPVIKMLFLTIVLPEVFVMACRECCRETETAILPHALIYPFWIFKLGKFDTLTESTLLIQ